MKEQANQKIHMSVHKLTRLAFPHVVEELMHCLVLFPYSPPPSFIGMIMLSSHTCTHSLLSGTVQALEHMNASSLCVTSHIFFEWRKLELVKIFLKTAILNGVY